MLRLRAVRDVLVDDIGHVRVHELDEPVEVLGKARRRAAMLAALDWIAILVLFAFRQLEGPFLLLGAHEQGVFTLGVLVVATHAGYCLGRWEKLGSVIRVLEALPAGEDSE